MRSPEPLMSFRQSQRSLEDALVAVVEARTELELSGAPKVRVEASKLIDECLAFGDLARQSPWPWQLATATARLDQQRKAVIAARDRYVEAVRNTETEVRR